MAVGQSCHVAPVLWGAGVVGIVVVGLRAWSRPPTTYPPAPSQIHTNLLSKICKDLYAN